MSKKRKREKVERGRKRFELSEKGVEKIELLVDFLIKFNLLAIPMYIVIFSGVELYSLQLLIADIVHVIIKAFGYEIVKKGIALTLVATPSVVHVVIGIDCTAWKSMYALAALMVASPVPNDRRKLKHAALGVLAIFTLNIIRLTMTILVGYWFGMWYLDIVHALLWREGMIFAVIVIWLIWLKKQKEKQKVIFRKEQTILRRLFKVLIEAGESAKDV